MCQNFYDVRTFGAVLVGKKGQGYNCGQVRGPVQLTFARSIDPILALDLSITRVALENAGDKPREDESEQAMTGTMGRKSIVPYGLYLAHGFYVPSFGEDTGFDENDLSLFWEALQRMWDLNRSASKGLTGCRGLYVFSHSSKLGNAPAHKLFERIEVVCKDAVTVPRKFTDYEVRVDKEALPYTLRGDRAHERVDIPVGMVRDGVRVEYALPLWSDELGLVGRADVVEFGESGIPYPVEHKVGKRRAQHADEVQLCGQVFCLEEMFETSISEGALYYARSRRRRVVPITSALRAETQRVIQEVRTLLQQGTLPPPVADERCRHCSLMDICIPFADRWIQEERDDPDDSQHPLCTDAGSLPSS
jgi:CRISPR-associated protein Cas4